MTTLFGIFVIFFIAFTFVRDTVDNSIHLGFLKKKTEEYQHPSDSQLKRRISMVANFAPASNQCGFIVGDVRNTKLSPKEIYDFYRPILTTPNYVEEQPYHEVDLFILKDEKDLKDISRLSPDLYNKIDHIITGDRNSYLLVSAEIGYAPNNDPRCH